MDDFIAALVDRSTQPTVLRSSMEAPTAFNLPPPILPPPAAVQAAASGRSWLLWAILGAAGLGGLVLIAVIAFCCSARAALPAAAATRRPCRLWCRQASFTPTRTPHGNRNPRPAGHTPPRPPQRRPSHRRPRRLRRPAATATAQPAAARAGGILAFSSDRGGRPDPANLDAARRAQRPGPGGGCDLRQLTRGAGRQDPAALVAGRQRAAVCGPRQSRQRPGYLAHARRRQQPAGQPLPIARGMTPSRPGRRMGA